MVKIAFYFLLQIFSDKQFIPGEPGYVEPMSVVTLYGEDVEEQTPTTEPPLYADTDDDDEEEISPPTEEPIVLCPLQDNLTRCDIYLCRVIRNMLALPFPACYGQSSS